MKRRPMMGMWRCALVTLALGGAGARGEVPTGSGIVQDEAFWKGLGERLGSGDAAVREAAEKAVEQVPWQGREELEGLLEKTTDEEVKGKLSARLEAIGVQLATDAPGLSVELHEAPLSEVVTALRKGTGIDMTEMNGGYSNGGPRFSVTAKDRPFWEIFSTLSAQHPLMVQRNERLQIVEDDRGLSNGVAATGGCWVFPEKVERARTAKIQAMEGDGMGKEELSLAWAVAVDPRCRIVSYQPLVLTEVKDDAGNDLLLPAKPRRNNVTPPRGEVLFRTTARLQLPANLGKKIVSAKGEAHFVMEVTERAVVVEKPAERFRDPVKLGGDTITIDAFEPKDETVHFQVSSKSGGVAGRRAGAPQVMMQILDKDNALVWETAMTGGASGEVSTHDHAPPLHLRFTAPDKTKDVVVPFEMKDLPLP